MATNSGGLLDFAASPMGQGLLAAAFGGLAGARRGAPANTLGAAGLAGVLGYQNALTRNSNEQYRNMQAKQIEANLQKQQMAMDMAGRFMNGGHQVSQGSQPAQGQSSANGAPQSSGGIPLNLNDVLAYNMLDLPNGSTVLDAYKLGSQPQERKSGSYYIDPRTGQQTYMPKLAEGVTLNGQGQAMPVPGASDSNAMYKGAEAGSVAAAQFPYQVGQTRAQQVGAASLDPMQVVGPDGNSYFTNRLDVASGRPNGQGGAQPFMAARNPTTQAAAQEVNKSWIGNSYQPTLDSGRTAQDMNNSISVMRTIPLETGWGTETKAAAANVLRGLGVPSNNAEMFATNTQQYQSIASERLMKFLQDQKGPQTEGDAERAKQMFVQLGNTPAANKLILDLAEARNNAAIRKASYYEKALPIALQNGGDLSEVDRQWRKVNRSIWDDPVMAAWKQQKGR